MEGGKLKTNKSHRPKTAVPAVPASRQSTKGKQIGGMDMTIFEQAKALATAREAAEYYGLEVERTGMACCPFHEDHTPSLKLDERFHCFGCGEDGDVIDFVSRLFGLTAKEAAEKIITDFGGGRSPTEMQRIGKRTQSIRAIGKVLYEMRQQIDRQRIEAAPVSPNGSFSHYAELCSMKDYITCMEDMLCDPASGERDNIIKYMNNGAMERYRRALEKGEIEYGDVFPAA
jgi:hypothetical protein